MTDTTDQFPKPLEKLILGTWDWLCTMVDARGRRPPNNRITPGSAGYKEQRRFLENGQVEFYRDGVLTETRSYSIEAEDEPLIPGRRSSRIYIGRDRLAFRLTADTLEISPMGFGSCGPTMVYRRAESIAASDA